jgi:hypothetical protein
MPRRGEAVAVVLVVVGSIAAPALALSYIPSPESNSFLGFQCSSLTDGPTSLTQLTPAHPVLAGNCTQLWRSDLQFTTSKFAQFSGAWKSNNPAWVEVFIWGATYYGWPPFSPDNATNGTFDVMITPGVTYYIAIAIQSSWVSPESMFSTSPLTTDLVNTSG